jgi:hypothetical protein
MQGRLQRERVFRIHYCNQGSVRIILLLLHVKRSIHIIFRMKASGFGFYGTCFPGNLKLFTNKETVGFMSATIILAVASGQTPCESMSTWSATDGKGCSHARVRRL